MSHPPLTVPEFQERWRGARLTERAAAQARFTDLCRRGGCRTPARANGRGDFDASERRTAETGGRAGSGS